MTDKLKKEFTPERLEGLPVISGKGNFAFWGAYRIIFSIKDALSPFIELG